MSQFTTKGKYLINREWNVDAYERPQASNTKGNYDEDTSLQLDNRQFTYKELKTLTNDFKKDIGKGGFGTVYLGHLEDGTPVAVKMRSQSSAQGIKEFLGEVFES